MGKGVKGKGGDRFLNRRSGFGVQDRRWKKRRKIRMKIRIRKRIKRRIRSRRRTG
jgi:hypothetical protein